jgi:hypothetical protein
MKFWKTTLTRKFWKTTLTRTFIVALIFFYLLSATYGLDHIWPHIVLLLYVCLLEINLLNRRIYMYKYVKEVNEEHIRLLVDHVHNRNMIIDKLIGEGQWIEKKPTPPVV